MAAAGCVGEDAITRDETLTQFHQFHRRAHLLLTIIIIKRNRSNASDSAYSYAFLRSVVCRLSVVCHTRSPCLNCSTDLRHFTLV